MCTVLQLCYRTQAIVESCEEHFKIGMLKPVFLVNRFLVVENRFLVLLTFIKNVLLYKANHFNFMYNTLECTYAQSSVDTDMLIFKI